VESREPILGKEPRRFQKRGANWDPLSDMIASGNPWQRMIRLHKRSTSPSAVVVVVHGIKCLCLVVRCTTTQTASSPFDFGRLVMKSTAMLCQRPADTDDGRRAR